MAERVSTAQAQGEGAPEPYEPNPYPWGLRLTLTNEQLAQFGIGRMVAGDAYEIDALAVIVRASSEDPDADGDIDQVCVELQVTEMALTAVAKSGKSDPAATMYGEKE